MKLQPYFIRLGHTWNGNVDYDTLRQIHYKHITNIPFENLDIYRGREIKLDLPALSEKILNSKRGGYCYELNGLFQMFLMAMGYTTHLISARVYNKSTSTYSPEFDHAAIIVEIDNTYYLADVGFGDFLYYPLKIEPDLVQQDNGAYYKINKTNDTYIVSMLEDGLFVPRYSFTITAYTLNDFVERNMFQQSSPESHFTKNTVCTLAKDTGRVTLTPSKLILTEKETRIEMPVEGEQAFKQYLYDYFNIVLK